MEESKEYRNETTIFYAKSYFKDTILYLELVFVGELGIATTLGEFLVNFTNLLGLIKNWEINYKTYDFDENGIIVVYTSENFDMQEIKNPKKSILLNSGKIAAFLLNIRSIITFFEKHALCFIFNLSNLNSKIYDYWKNGGGYRPKGVLLSKPKKRENLFVCFINIRDSDIQTQDLQFLQVLKPENKLDTQIHNEIELTFPTSMIRDSAIYKDGYQTLISGVSNGGKLHRKSKKKENKKKQTKRKSKKRKTKKLYHKSKKR